MRLDATVEFFPPTDPDMESLLWTSVRHLAPLEPRLVSVTYGADGSTRDRTLEIDSRLRQETTLSVAPHITSIGSSRESVQFFFDNSTYLRFRDDCVAAAIDVSRSNICVATE